MQNIMLHVGPTPYTVLLSDRSIYDRDGMELEGCAVEGRRLIVLSRIVEPQRREEVAQHEFYHCWLFHVPQPADEEAAAQLHSLVSRQFAHDIDVQGGRDIFLRMASTRVVLGRPAVEHEPAAAKSREIHHNFMECGVCGTLIHLMAIHTGAPAINEDTGRHQVQRWMQCESCGAVHAWHELSGPNGTPLGAMCEVPAPRMLRGAEAAAFMAEHEREAAWA